MSLFAQPVRIAEYAELPELQASYFIAAQGYPVADVEMHILGSQPKTRSPKKVRNTVPHLYIHELADIIYADGILYSPRSKCALIDSVRSFGEALTPRLYYGPHTRLRSLGRGFYVPEKAPPATEVTAGKNLAFMPCFTSYPVYGHWLLEALTSLWAHAHVQRLAGNAPVRLLLSPMANIPDYMKLFAEPFGITDYDFYYPSRRMRLDRIFIPTKSYMHMAYVSEVAKKMWQHVVNYYLPDATMDPIEKIYLSRRHIKARRLENEQEIERFFEQQGFTVIESQNLSLANQICLFAHAARIAGPVGSAVHNVVFSQNPQQLKTLFLGPEDYTSFSAIAVIEQAYGRKAYFVQGSERTRERRSWHVPLHEVQMAYEQWTAE
ncbi:MAG: hypothetical protein BCS36_05535 [Desulfovibrio sp. MES5]|uniref:glycosyltransferase family 61 protein n=1 Tax=Desulfovibrio sp. MES5 TaxID=1899016 RepID=UPI000B9D4B3E|nr:MAG: hypothetical protein BCS36_05535 [Desulfovibrio sp. MES5]